MTESQKKSLATWLMENIVKGDGSEYLDFEEISSKLTSILPKKKLRQLVKLFSNVERKTGRSRGMKNMHLCAFIYMSFVVQISICSYTDISWHTVSPIKFHANCTLECRIESTEGGIPKWSGGYSNHILTFNRASYFKEKYAVELNKTQMIYNLTILDFNEHDVNVLYTCYYGFEQYSKNLTLDSVNFTMLPEKGHASPIYANDILDLNITLERVWPKPVCSLLINNKNYTEFTNEAVKTNGIFLDSEYTFRGKMDGNVELLVNMTCIIGTFENPYTIIKHIKQENTTSVTGENSTSTMAWIAAGGVCIFMIIMVLLCARYGVKLRDKICEVARYSLLMSVISENNLTANNNKKDLLASDP